MNVKNETNGEKKEVYVLIRVKPKYVEEFCIMMIACKERCNRASKSKNLAEMEEVFSVLGPYDFLLKLSGGGAGEGEKIKKINKTIFKIRETLGNYINETCTLTQFKLSENFTKDEANDLFGTAELFEESIENDDKLNHFKNFLGEEGIFNNLEELQKNLDFDVTPNRLFHLKHVSTEHLNKGIIDGMLKEEFNEHDHSLSDKAKLSIIDDNNWKIIDDTARYRMYSTGGQLYAYKIKKNKEVHILIKVKPKYTEEFLVAMVVFKSLYNRATPSKDLAKVAEVCSMLGPFDFLLKIRGEVENGEEEEIMHEQINKTILKIRETLGAYIYETLTLEKFKIPMKKEELEELFEKIIGEKNLAKLPDMDAEKIPDEGLETGKEIDLKDIYDAETTSLKNLLKRPKTFLESDDLNKRIDELADRVRELEKKS